MSTLVVVGYDDPYMAEDIRLKLRKLQSEYLLDLEDAVVAVKDERGKVKLHQAVNLTADGAVSGGFWGSDQGHGAKKMEPELEPTKSTEKTFSGPSIRSCSTIPRL